MPRPNPPHTPHSPHVDTRLDENLVEMEGAHILFPILGVLFSITWAVVLFIGITRGIPRDWALGSGLAFLGFALLFGLRHFRLAMPFLVVSGAVAMWPLMQ
jgi:ABC-type multidrug transport system fused ATPase/permease subunit